jgi:hypothetical protein
MPRVDRMLDRMQANPRDWRIESLEAVAAAHGVNVRKPGAATWFRASWRRGSDIGAGAAADQTGLCPPLCRIHRGGASEP